MTHRLRTAVLNSLTIHSFNRRSHPVPRLCPRQADIASDGRTRVPLIAFILALNYAKIILSLSLIRPPQKYGLDLYFLTPYRLLSQFSSLWGCLYTSLASLLSLNCSSFFPPPLSIRCWLLVFCPSLLLPLEPTEELRLSVCFVDSYQHSA